MIRHRSFGDAMSALLAYKHRPEDEIAPIKTNWSLTPENDIEPDVVLEMGYERIQLVTPSISEIMRQVEIGDLERNEAGQVTRIGRLRFSDGSQVEAGYKIGPGGEVVAVKHRMPVGAMLGAQDRPHTTIGGDDNPSDRTASNRYFAELFGVKVRSRVAARKKSKRNGRGYSREEAKAMLAEAYANTPVLPEIKQCPPGLPLATDRIADNFLGMKKGMKGDAGSAGWQDVSTAIVDREIWAQAIAELSSGDRQVLDTVAHHRIASQYTISPGGTERGARKRGLRLLTAANDNLKKNLEKAAS